MDKIMILSIMGLYFFYYVGNITYDLILAKNNSIKIDESSEEFSFDNYNHSATNEVKDISIEDVESINTPDSFSKRENFKSHISDHNEQLSQDEMREKFEEERELENLQNEESPVKKADNNNFENLLNQAKTNVQLVANNGFKEYRSTM